MSSNSVYRNTPKDYYHHDNRRGGASRGQGRPGRYQNNRKAGGGRGYLKGNYVHVDGDGDICMGDDEPRDSGSRFAPYSKPGYSDARGGFRRGRGRGRSGGGADNGRNRDNSAGSSRGRSHTSGHHRQLDEKGWHKIYIPHGRRFEKNFILKSLTHNCPIPFIPVNYHLDGNGAVFYVEDNEAAAALAQLHQKLMSPFGQKMTILVRPSQFPMGTIPPESLEQVKLCISRRYNPDLGVLDLSCFDQDMTLKAGGHFLPLYRQAVALNAIATIEENVHHLVVLNLSGNKMRSLQTFSELINKQRGLKTLLINDNLISEKAELRRLKDLPIEELTLKNNPLMRNHKIQTQLVDTLRKIFPKLVRLDGETLPPLISFDVEVSTCVPESLGSFFVNNGARDLAVQFLEQYFTMFDSVNRKGLVDAYHDSAMFAVSAYRPQWGSHLTEYLRHQRNLLRVPEPERRTRSLYRGKLDIVACLQRLPATQHDALSLVVDVPLSTPTLTTITTSGVFKEVDAKSSSDMRAFSRTFVLVPHGSGFNIVNETLFVTNATPEQIRKAFKPQATLLPGLVGPSLVAVNTTSPTAQNAAALQQQMLAAFSQQSGMNNEWAGKCLEDNNWDFDKAAKVFAELHANGSIPMEAFVK